MNELYLYNYHQGLEDLYGAIKEQTKDSLFAKTVIIIPNRMLGREIQNYFLNREKNFSGIELLTFDDLFKRYSLVNAAVPQALLALFLERILDELAEEEKLNFFYKSSRFKSLSEELLQLFEELLAQSIEPEKLEQGHSLEIKELAFIYRIYLDFLKRNRIYSQGRLSQLALARIERGVTPQEHYFVYGFSSLRPVEYRLLKALLDCGLNIPFYMPFGKETLNLLVQDTIEKLEALDYKCIDRRESKETFEHQLKLKSEESIDILCASRDIVLYKEILGRVQSNYEAGTPLFEQVVYTTTSKEREDFIEFAQRRGVPIYNPLERIDLGRSPFFNDLKIQLTWHEEGKVGLLKRLSSRYFPLSNKCSEAIDKLQSLKFETVEQLEELLFKVKTQSVDKQTYDLLREVIPDYIEEYHRIDKNKHSYWLRRLRNLLITVDREVLNDSDQALYDGLIEVYRELLNYEHLLPKMDGDSFIDLLTQGLSRMEFDQELVQGLNVLSFEDGLSGSFSDTYVLGLDSDWPTKKSRSFLNSRSIEEELLNAGFIKDREELNFLKGSLQLDLAIAPSKETVLGWTGEEGEESLVLIDLFKQLPFQPKFIFDYIPTAPESSRNPKEQIRSSIREGNRSYVSNWTIEQWNVLNQRNKGDLNYNGNLGPEMTAQLKRELSKGNYSATLIDQYLSCPFKLLMERFVIPNYKGREEVSRDSLDVGNIYHKVLEKYYRHYDESSKWERLYRYLETEYKLSPFVEGKSQVEQTLELNSLYSTLVEFIKEDEKRLNDKKKDMGFWPSDYEKFFSMNINGINFKGFIDRIDVNEKGQEIVIDYKKNNCPNAESFKNEEVWQLALYGYYCWKKTGKLVGLSYGSIEGKSFKPMLRHNEALGKYGRSKSALLLDDTEFQAYFDTFPKRLGMAVETLAQGEFPPKPIKEDDCRYCLYRKICRKEEVVF